MSDANVFARPAVAQAGEVFEELLRGGSFRLERIVSTGQSTPPDEWYDQAEAEWVVLLSGIARLRFEDEPADRELQPGDYLLIAPHRRHRVTWTEPQQPTVWLALHFS
jgi:cupin 2 domain-containing protein